MCVVLGRSVVGGGSEGLLGRPPAMTDVWSRLFSCWSPDVACFAPCGKVAGVWRARGGVICEKCSEKLHSYPAYPACSVEPLEIWLTHVQRAFREKAVSHFRPDCQPRGRGGVSCCVARPLKEPSQRPPLAWTRAPPRTRACARGRDSSACRRGGVRSDPRSCRSGRPQPTSCARQS